MKAKSSPILKYLLSSRESIVIQLLKISVVFGFTSRFFLGIPLNFTQRDYVMAKIACARQITQANTPIEQSNQYELVHIDLPPI